MTSLLRFLLPAWALLAATLGLHADPLRVFIRAGAKTHGPNQHDHPRFLGDWTKLLGERGLKVAGGMEFPTAAQLDGTDVVVIYAADGMKITGADREHFEKYLSRGGGVVVVHDGVVSGDQNDWCKKIIGGSWRWDGEKKTQWREGEVGLYFVNNAHPIVKGISNFDWKDEVYNQLDMADDVNVLAQSFVDVFNIWPQLWTYEKTLPGGTAPYRAFVSIPGHEYDSFLKPHYRAILLRGIAWAGGRPNADEFCNAEELGSLTYPEGGPKPADKAVSTFQLHPEFNVSITADERVSEKIMSIDWDEKGRMWVVETPEYPGGRDVNKNDFKAYWNRARDPKAFPVGSKEERKPQDRISILEDTNGDGVMDKKTVFADGLELPTSSVFWKDGVIVAQAPDILWIRDTNGDGKADKMEVLYTGWGTFDTHAVINNFRWGLDGWVYGTVGYTRGRVKSGDGKKDFGDIAAGVYRFKPDGSMLEQIAAGGCNTWGCEVAPDGEIVFTTATCGEPICHVVIPEKILARGQVGGMKSFRDVIEENKIYPAFDEKRQPYVQIDWVGAWTAAAGAAIYDGGAWPAKWAPEDRYSFFMGEATRQLFHHEFLDPKGPSYQGRKEEGRKQTEFLASTDYWFRPIHSRVGPDGAMYVVDFYNQIAVHNDTRGPAHGARNAATRPDRDHHFTRVWRIQHKEARKLPAVKLNRRDAAGLVDALNSPNGWTRNTANRLLNEDPSLIEAAFEDLSNLISDTSVPAATRVHALWLYRTAANYGPVPWSEQVSNALFNDASPWVRKNTLRVAAELSATPDRLRSQDGDPVKATEQAVIERLKDSDGRVKINALIAAGTIPSSRALADAVVAVWPTLKDRWYESAAIGAADRDPLLFIEAAFASKDPAFLADLVPHLARLVANKKDPALAGRLVQLLARQPAGTDGLKAAVLESLSASLDARVVPALDADTLAALKALLASGRTAGSTVPLVARWNAATQLAEELKPAIARAAAQLSDTSLGDDIRGRIAANLVGVRNVDPSVIGAVAGLVTPAASPALQKRVIEALGTAPEGALALVSGFSKLPTGQIETAFAQILKRAESTAAFIEALSRKEVDVNLLGPARLHRLRTHGDSKIAARATQVIDDLKGPEAKEKDALIAKLTPEILKAGDVENGHKVFTANCAGCHVFKTEGRNLAPNLTGMGAHGAADLLVHIVDPNRLVEPNFISVSIETKSGDQFDGVVDRENAAEVVLRDASSDHTIRVSDIANRRSTGRSLMPEGFEALGAPALRDLLAYICADDNRFRLLDLSGAFTANSGRGLYISPENEDETVSFRSYGLKRVEDIPFDVVSPNKAVANVVLLKGGAPDSWSRKTMPRRVEVKVGVATARLHFLGGVAGWGYPAIDEKVPALKATAHFAGGATQEIVFRNGVEIADYRGRPDVDGSKGLPSWTKGPGQIRWHSRNITQPGVLEKLVLESYDNAVAPTLFAITAELGAPAGPEKAAAARVLPVLKWGDGLKTLLIGGGASHDYERFFNLADVALLNGAGHISANYLEPQDVSVASVKGADVLVISANKAFPDAAVREAVMAHAAAGKGLVLLHPGLWYNWNEWATYNRELAGGGSRGHDRYGEFDVTVSGGSHPLMKGVPASFRLSDELYYFEPDAQGTPIQVLATAFSKSKDKAFPQVFVVQHPKTRIAGITLGHDGVAHSHAAYQQLLKNAVYWSAKKDEWITAAAR